LSWSLSTGGVGIGPQIASAIIPATSLKHDVRHMLVPRPHAGDGPRLPSHDQIDDPIRYAEQHEYGRGRVPDIVKPGVPDLRGLQQPLSLVIGRCSC
jgi:hypothetical protein